MDIKSIEQRLQYLEDESAIRSLAGRFADMRTAADYEEFKNLWSVNGKWTIHEPFFASSKGIEKIDELLRYLRTGKEFFVYTFRCYKNKRRQLKKYTGKTPKELYENENDRFMMQKDNIELMFQRSDTFKNDVVFSKNQSIGATISFYLPSEKFTLPGCFPLHL